MSAKKILLLAMAICLANGVKAQFYDSADEIYYYVETKTVQEPWTDFLGNHPGNTIVPEENDAIVKIFNFDGKKAAELTNVTHERVKSIKRILQESPTRFEDRVETIDYDLKHKTSSSGIVYTKKVYTYTFSKDRSSMIANFGADNWKTYFMRVDKSYFKAGRSRTPSSGMYE